MQESRDSVLPEVAQPTNPKRLDHREIGNADPGMAENRSIRQVSNWLL